MRYQVKLANVGNIDRDQDPSRPLLGAPNGQWRDVPDLGAASKACREYIDEHGLGSGNWSGGDVRDTESKKVIARVSYNGRVWDLDGKEVEIRQPAAKSPGCGM